MLSVNSRFCTPVRDPRRKAMVGAVLVPREDPAPDLRRLQRAANFVDGAARSGSGWEAAKHSTMAKKKSKTANLQKLGFKALEYLRPVVYYGFIPAVILVGMRTEPRPRCVPQRGARHRGRGRRARARADRARACVRRRPAQHSRPPDHHVRAAPHRFARSLEAPGAGPTPAPVRAAPGIDVAHRGVRIRRPSFLEGRRARRAALSEGRRARRGTRSSSPTDALAAFSLHTPVITTRL